MTSKMNPDGTPATKASTSNVKPNTPLAMPVDRESSLFSMTPEQHQKMVEQLQAEFLSGKNSTKQEPEMDDPNRPETEEDGFRAGQLRHLKVIHDAKVARLRSIDPNLPQEEKDRLAAKINEETEQRRALVLNRR